MEDDLVGQSGRLRHKGTSMYERVLVPLDGSYVYLAEIERGSRRRACRAHACRLRFPSRRGFCGHPGHRSRSPLPWRRAVGPLVVVPLFGAVAVPVLLIRTMANSEAGPQPGLRDWCGGSALSETRFPTVLEWCQVLRDSRLGPLVERTLEAQTCE